MYKKFLPIMMLFHANVLLCADQAHEADVAIADAFRAAVRCRGSVRCAMERLTCTFEQSKRPSADDIAALDAGLVLALTTTMELSKACRHAVAKENLAVAVAGRPAPLQDPDSSIDKMLGLMEPLVLDGHAASLKFAAKYDDFDMRRAQNRAASSCMMIHAEITECVQHAVQFETAQRRRYFPDA